MTQHSSATGAAPTANPTDALAAALARWDGDALRHQRLRQPLILFAVVLGPIAVLLLSVQALMFPEGGVLATGLIAVELTALTVALWFGLLSVGKSTHNRWLSARLRAEAIRRERFMFQARLGPYLNLDDQMAAAQVTRRLLILDSDRRNPVDLLPLSDGNGSWRDTFEETEIAYASVPLRDARAIAVAYLTGRVADQRGYFSLKADAHRDRSEGFENAARVTLTLALLIAAIHLGLLLSNPGEPPHLIHAFLVIAAVTLPAIGSAFAAMQSAAGSLRLSRSYDYYAEALEPHEQALIEMTEDPASNPLSTVQERQFRRTVLTVEQLLSDELRQWWTIMAPTGPKAGA